MDFIGDILGDEGRKALDACVKVKIFGNSENIPKYHWRTAWKRLDECFAGFDNVGPVYQGRPDRDHGWLQYPHLRTLILPIEMDEYGNQNVQKICNIFDIHDALVNYDKMLCVEKDPRPGPGSDELKELIDKRRADIERECEEATADPDGRQRYSWLVAQRRVRDCFAGSFAGDCAFLICEPERINPDELYSIIDIHDAVVYHNQRSFFYKESIFICHPDYICNDPWKVFGAERESIEKEFKEAMSNPDEVVEEYSRGKAEQRVKDCFQSPFPWHKAAEILPIKKDESGMLQITPAYSILDIHKAMQHFDEKKFIQKYPEDEGPGTDELKKAIEKHNLEMKKEYQEGKCGLCRYSQSHAEERVRDCFMSSEVLKVEFLANQTYDIFDIHKTLLSFDEIDPQRTADRLVRNSVPSEMDERVKKVKRNRDAISKEHQRAKIRLRGYSRNEAERRARDCFAGTFEQDTDILPTEDEEKPWIHKIKQTYDISEIKEALDCFDVKKLRDKYLDKKYPQSKSSNQSVDENRAEVEREYAEATAKVEIEHGSGFIVHDHFIITNKHVIEDAVDDKAKEICISNAVVGELPCEVAYCDAAKDLALLYCQALNSKERGICPLQLTNKPLLPGMQIFSFGYPMSHTGDTALLVNGHVSGSKKKYSGPTLAVLNCALNSGNSGGPVLCWVSGQLKVVGVATQKHFKEILTLEERAKIEKIRESLQTSTIPSVPDDALKSASFSREKASFYSPRPDACQTPMFLLTLKLYDALETHSQFNLGNALPGHCVIEFINESISKHEGEGKKELVEIVKWSEDHANILPSGHHSASDCCIQ